MKDFTIERGHGYDFHIVQNYVLQLLAEKFINNSAFVLYSFYQSLNGFENIRCSYDYIRLNTGLSKGSLTKANQLLEKAGLIKIKNGGQNMPNQIFIKDGNKLPRRTLKKVDRSEQNENKEYDSIEFEPTPVIEDSPNEHAKNDSSSSEQLVQEVNAESSTDESINIENTEKELYRNNTTTGARSEKELFLKEFKEYWCKMNRTDKYRAQDDNVIDKIDNFKLARKLIPILWHLDENDKWVKKSNHSLKVFVKEYLNGNLQTHYPKTSQYYKDKNKEEMLENVCTIT